MDIKQRLACFHSHLNAHQVEKLPDQYARLPPELQDYLDSPHGSPLYARIEEDLDWLHGSDHRHIIVSTDPHYPPLLKEINDAPCLLFAIGDISLLQFPALAIVGSRKPSREGIENATHFASRLAQQGLCIISGLAYGIDAAAHQASLRCKGRTIAIIGTGMDIVYPQAHLSLAKQIAAQGLILSSFPRKTKPLKQNFPLRNRIISGMSLGVLVIEAGIQSGALITARLAAEQGREVCALPGSIHSPTTKGCHKLIREGAKLVESYTDILDELEPLFEGYRMKVSPSSSADERDEAQPSSMPTQLSSQAQQLFEQIRHHPIHPDQLAAETDLSIEHITAALTELEICALVAQDNGLYSRTSRTLGERASH